MLEIEICKEEDCTGCAACMNTCNMDAIQMKKNKYGFLKPIINTKKCIRCQECKNVCNKTFSLHRKKNEVKKVYATWAKNPSLHKQGNSGGLFSVFAKVILEMNGIVCAAKYGDGLTVYHDIIEQIEDIPYLAYSKFNQSSIGYCLRKIKNFLLEGRYVLFVGTPCQIEGLYSFLRLDYKNLITVQFPCFGIPSSLMFTSYIHYQFANDISQVKEFYCEVQDNKDINQRFMKCIKINGEEKKIFAGKDKFVRLWNAGYGIEERCLKCERNTLPCNADFVWGNFWQIGSINKFNIEKKKYEDGISFLILNNEKALDFFVRIEPELEYYERTLVEVLSGHYYMQTSTEKHLLMKKIFLNKKRREFMEDLVNMPFEQLVKKYCEKEEKSYKFIVQLLNKKIIAIMWRFLYYIQKCYNKRG